MKNKIINIDTSKETEKIKEATKAIKVFEKALENLNKKLSAFDAKIEVKITDGNNKKNAG